MNDGGPAFPRPVSVKPDGEIWNYGQEGMTLREWFAGLAMQGMCSGKAWPADSDMPEIARRAVAMADVLLAKLTGTKR